MAPTTDRAVAAPHPKKPQTPHGSDGAVVLAALDEAMARTAELVAPLSDEDYRRPHHPVLGPIAWDVGHMTQQMDLWLVQALGGRRETLAGANQTYDAYENPRPGRARLPLLDRAEVAVYRGKVREAIHEVMRRGPTTPDDRRWRDHWLFWMVVLHEHQHQETILQGLVAMPPGRYVPKRRERHPPATVDAGLLRGYVYMPGGRFAMGVPAGTPKTYDNEWPAHEAEVGPFWIAKAPVTNGQYFRFIEAGGYQEPAYWAPEGWAMVTEEGLRHPLYWHERGDGWQRQEVDEVVPLGPDQPVCHISWYEADAFARWAGRRLPTEAEWEKAATWDPVRGRKRLWPWGDAPVSPARANLDHLHWGPDPVGSHPEGATPEGVHQMVGDVWEWTSTTFGPYPGFAAFPYRDYSERFFADGLKVLRGGSWASRPGLRFGTFRNWDLPIRRQIFAGVRLAADAPRGAATPPEGGPAE